MSKIIGLLSITFALIGVISAVLIPNKYELEAELSAKLDQAKKLKVDAVERILLEVDEDYRSEIKVLGISVAEILSYKDTSCSVQAFADVRLLENKCIEFPSLDVDYRFVGTIWNDNVSRFIKTHLAERIKSCAENFFSLFENAVEEIKIHESFFEDFVSKKRIPGWLTFRATERDRKKDNRFKNCVTLVRKLSVAKFFQEDQSIYLEPGQRQVTEKWYNYLRSCKSYTKKLCYGYYYSDIDRYTEIELDKEKTHPDDDLSAECPTIRDILFTYQCRNDRALLDSFRDKNPLKKGFVSFLQQMDESVRLPMI